MSVINTNVLALTSQNNLSKSQNALGTAIERLSSGLRINSAKDDAAGQAIANRFTANIKGLTQASRNANDGISIAQTTEGALNEINNNLQRIRELSVQAANGSNSSSDLDSIQAEIGQRLEEINRVSEQTQFNGVNVLAKDRTGDSALKIQVGANDGQTIDINLKQIDAGTLGLDTLRVTNSITASEVEATAPADGKIMQGGVASVDVSDFDVPATDVGDSGVGAQGDWGTLQYKSDDGSFYVEYTGGIQNDGTADAAGNGWYSVSVDANGAISLGSKLGSAPTGTAAAAVGDGGGTEITLTGADVANVRAYNGSGNQCPAYVIQEGTGADAKYYEANISAEGAVTRGGELSTEPKTADPLAQIDAALQQVDSLRSDLGAIQNRFESTIANLSNTVNNLSAARSRIEDADYAVEVSNMTRAQILQQAGTSVLAQANQVPQTVLSLLR